MNQTDLSSKNLEYCEWNDSQKYESTHDYDTNACHDTVKPSHMEVKTSS